jgi:hypothetical protein
MQATTALPPPQAPAAPPAPAPVAAPVVAGTPQTVVRPATAREVEALRERGNELSNQLQSATGRRNRLAEQLKTSDPGARAGLEQRIQQLDQRILRIEGDIAENGRLLATARPELVTETGVPWLGLDGGGTIAVAGSFTLLAIMLMGVLRALRRRPAPAAVVTRDAESDRRLERLEQGVEAIAVEIERISEGQRYITKLMTETPALGAGDAPAEPIKIRQPESVRRD